MAEKSLLARAFEAVDKGNYLSEELEPLIDQNGAIQELMRAHLVACQAERDARAELERRTRELSRELAEASASQKASLEALGRAVQLEQDRLTDERNARWLEADRDARPTRPDEVEAICATPRHRFGRVLYRERARLPGGLVVLDKVTHRPVHWRGTTEVEVAIDVVSDGTLDPLPVPQGYGTDPPFYRSTRVSSANLDEDATPWLRSQGHWAHERWKEYTTARETRKDQQ